MIKFFKELYQLFIKSDTFQKGAALAYYTVFSLIPIIVIVTAMLGVIFGEQAVTGEIYHQLKDLLGEDASMQIQNIIREQYYQDNGLQTSLIGFGTLCFTASGMLSQMHNSFNKIWNVQIKPENSIVNFIMKRIVALGILLFTFFIILSSTALNSFLVAFTDQLGQNFALTYIWENLISLIVLSLVFGILFKFLGDTDVQWKPAIYGGAFTAVLFILGKIGISFYISKSNVSSTFGPASALAVLMIWVFYTSQILFLGACFVKVIGDWLGKPVLPDKNAMREENVECDTPEVA